MQIWAETGKSALPIRNYSQILYQFLKFTQNLKRSPVISPDCSFYFSNIYYASFVVTRINTMSNLSLLE